MPKHIIKSFVFMHEIAAGGKLGQIFERVSKLPRRQQQKIIEMGEGFLSLHENDK